MEKSKKISILDLVFINQGSNAAEAISNSVKAAVKAEELGYNRIWIAEHHNFPSIASAATSVVIGHLAGHTKTIRIGAGGIMLPNHAPLVIAEQFGTLATLYPGRIDLGVGRAPGTDQLTVRALRRDPRNSDNFPEDVVELLTYFEGESEQGDVKAYPAIGTFVPVWILGSSLYGAQLAAHLGLPYAFASHFAPAALMDAIRIYRENFKPSIYLEKPYVMVGLNVVAAETDVEADFLFSSAKQSFAGILNGRRGPFPPPKENIESTFSFEESQFVRQMLAVSVVGSEATVRVGINRLWEETGADELMVASSIYDTNARLRSLEILAEVNGK